MHCAYECLCVYLCMCVHMCIYVNLPQVVCVELRRQLAGLIFLFSPCGVLLEIRSPGAAQSSQRPVSWILVSSDIFFSCFKFIY